MAREELQFQLDQLNFQLEKQSKQHAEDLEELHQEARQLRKSITAALDRKNATASEGELPSVDSCFVRRVEWLVEDFSGRVQNTPKGEAIWSPEFAVLGMPGLRLEFFPNGRENTKFPGFCALFLWCPAGSTVKYRLRVGNHIAPADEDEYTGAMGHGHSTFCHLESQRDSEQDSIRVGVEVVSACYKQDLEPGVKLINAGPEKMAERELAALQNRHKDTIHWKINNIRKRILESPRGTAICSPSFSIAGVRSMLMEFYPNGVEKMPNGKECREGYCSFYLRASRDQDRMASGPFTLFITLFVGGSKKGPIRTEFDGNAAKGLPEFCILEEQLDSEEFLVVGVQVRNDELVSQTTELHL